jgi:hypothetical protein
VKRLRRLALFVTAMCVVLSCAAGGAVAATPGPPYAVKRGDAKPAVKSVQWLLGGHRPSAYRNSIRTFPYRPNGLYGARTVKAVRNAKWRLGYPIAYVNGNRAERPFLLILLGKQARPVAYLQRAAWRLKHSPSYNAVIPGTSTMASRIIGGARAQLNRPCGRTYECWGENHGPLVQKYQASTGAYRAPWCVSFVQWALKLGGYGYTANRSAAVFYVVSYWRARGRLRSQAAAGRLVAFTDRLGHIGFVERVFAGGFYSIEGNASDSVLRRRHTIGSRPMVFISLPGVS